MSEPSRSGYILRATAFYLLFGLGWIVLSDRVLLALSNPLDLAALSAAKGIFFVLVSAAALFLALRSVPGDKAAASDAGLPDPAPENGLRQRWLSYAFSVLVTGCMLLVHQAMKPMDSGHPQFILFVLPIALSALVGGLGPGLMATLVALVGIDLMSQPALHSLAASPQDQFRWSLLLVNGLVLSLLSDRLRRANVRLQRSSRLLNSVVTGTSDAVFVKDRQGHYLLANAAAGAFVNQAPASMLGVTDAQLFDPASAQHLRELDLQVMQSARVQTHEEGLTTLDGQQRVFMVTKGPVVDEAGTVSGLFGIARDITHLKADQERLQTSEAALREREQQLARVLQGSDQGYWDWHLPSNTFVVSARWETMLGFEPGEMDVGPHRWPDIVHPEDLPAAMASIERHLQGESDAHVVEIRCRTKQGDWRWILSRGSIVQRSEAGQPLIMAGTHTDITEHKQSERALREASVVFESSHEGIMMVNPDGLITKVNPAFTRITGFSEAEVSGRSPRLLASGQHGEPFYQELWRSLQQHDFWRGEICNRRRNGELYVAQETISVVRDPQGQVLHYIGVFSDISQLKAHAAELDRVAHYDLLTGLPNRHLLSDRMSQSIRRSQRSGHPSAVCVLDLDGFKHINDRYGHTVGDQLLIELSTRLQQVLRAEDTLARTGGDEFVLVLSEVGSTEECTLILDRLLQAVRQPLVLPPELSLSVSASIGVSLYPADNADPDTLLRHADQAMYLAKQAGKNRYQLFDPESDRLAQAHRQSLETLERALAQGEFVLYYQPKVDLDGGEVIGAEALIRWQHPERGLLPPGEFLPLVHGSTLEPSLGEWVIASALAQLGRWQSQGLNMKVSVNISANHLLRPEFCARLSEALARHPEVPPAHLELEVLESAAIADMGQAVDILRNCRALGVHFSLDDFGTGYSSLTYLRQLPVDTLKIDQSFVRDMLTDPDDLRIVQSVIQLAGVFHRQVIAEGVETLEHGARLRQMGCHCVQGYGIARPMPAQNLPGWCAGWLQAQAWQHL